MPSSNKTPYADLNQWGPSDKPKWEDHNIDNRNTDAKLQEHRTAIDGLAGGFHGPYIGEDGYWYEWDVETAQYVQKGPSVGPPGGNGPAGPANVLSIGTVEAGEEAAATITGTSPAQVLNLTLPIGPEGPASTVPGPTGRGIVSIIRTSGTGAPGTTDTYTITYTDETTDTYSVYNGADGSGSGDMSKAVYDPSGKAADAFSMANMVEGATQKIMTADERTKLDGIAENANNYAHPANHPPSIITQDASNRFVTDAEKTTWNGKQGALGFTPVPDTREVNGKALSADVTLTASDVGAAASPSSLTALPDSGTALTNNAEYRVATAVGTYVFAWPDSPFECWLRFTTAATFSITFPSGTTYIGGAPTFKASTTYEMSVKDGVVIVQEVAAA